MESPRFQFEHICAQLLTNTALMSSATQCQDRLTFHPEDHAAEGSCSSLGCLELPRLKSQSEERPHLKTWSPAPIAWTSFLHTRQSDPFVFSTLWEAAKRISQAFSLLAATFTTVCSNPQHVAMWLCQPVDHCVAPREFSAIFLVKINTNFDFSCLSSHQNAHLNSLSGCLVCHLIFTPCGLLLVHCTGVVWDSQQL